MRARRTCTVLATGTIAAFAGLAMGQSTFTGAYTPDPTNWCDSRNWDPPAVPPSGSEIILGPGTFANMVPCQFNGALYTIGPLSGSGSARFWHPVFLQGGGTLTDPIFDFNEIPIGIAGTLTLSGDDAQWHGGIFRDGEISNTGTLTVQRGLFGGRSMPRALIDGHRFVNTGSLHLIDGFNIESNSQFVNLGRLECHGSNVTIETVNGPGSFGSPGTVFVPATRALTIQQNFVGTTLESAGTLTIAGATTTSGPTRVISGGLIRFSPQAGTPVQITGNVEGDGSVQILSGQTLLHSVTVTAAQSGRGLWFACGEPITLSGNAITVNAPGVLTWSRGHLTGSGAGTHITIASGARLDKFGIANFGSGNGNATGVNFNIAGSMGQYANTQLLGGSTVTVPVGGRYLLSRCRLDGDYSGLLDVAGRLEINPTDDPRIDPAFMTGVPTRITGEGRLAILRGQFVTGFNGAPSTLELSGAAAIELAHPVFGQPQHDSRLRLFGDTRITGGAPEFRGGGVVELAPGAFLSIGAGQLTSRGYFEQFGTLRADPSGGSGSFISESQWVWNSGQIAFPPANPAPVVNRSSMFANCSNCTLAADLLNERSLDIAGTLTLARAGATLTNASTIFLRGHVASSAPATLLRNAGTLNKCLGDPSTISAPLDNSGTIDVGCSQLTISGPILQCNGGVLTGGTWNAVGTLRTPSCTITAVGEGTAVSITGGSDRWPQFLPRSNSGTINFGLGNYSLPQNFENFGRTTIFGGSVTIGGGQTYRQPRVFGPVTVLDTGILSSDQPVDIEGGRVEGHNGTINAPAVNNSGGTVSPGRSPGILTFTGDYTQSAAATLEIELAGYTPGAQHDVLAVGGIASLDGTLRVSLLDGFSPVVGDSFTVLTAPVITGTFAAVTPPAPLATTLRMAVDVGPSSVVVRFACATDFNADGNIDPDDLGDFINCYFSVPPCAEADFNADGNTDPDDLGDFINVYFAGGC